MNEYDGSDHKVCSSDSDFNISLQEDLTIEILRRLPVKSLIRFCCVCKSWKTLIRSNDNFIKKSYLKLSLCKNPNPTNKGLILPLLRVVMGLYVITTRKCITQTISNVDRRSLRQSNAESKNTTRFPTGAESNSTPADAMGCRRFAFYISLALIQKQFQLASGTCTRFDCNLFQAYSTASRRHLCTATLGVHDRWVSPSHTLDLGLVAITVLRHQPLRHVPQDPLALFWCDMVHIVLLQPTAHSHTSYIQRPVRFHIIRSGKNDPPILPRRIKGGNVPLPSNDNFIKSHLKLSLCKNPNRTNKGFILPLLGVVTGLYVITIRPELGRAVHVVVGPCVSLGAAESEAAGPCVFEEFAGSGGFDEVAGSDAAEPCRILETAGPGVMLIQMKLSQANSPKASSHPIFQLEDPLCHGHAIE
ncbi:hypothetical protein M9H77_34132 [Catharanthus roseus]|uniref:Uncharacterized protein n=1 Tax=Catharanthus roseus TaxID=4058 RepID=A0ACB9ZKC5_CATRO|nr:hypothetical protein M9H77_34132 [Catharanthus roseus]